MWFVERGIPNPPYTGRGIRRCGVGWGERAVFVEKGGRGLHTTVPPYRGGDQTKPCKLPPKQGAVSDGATWDGESVPSFYLFGLWRREAGPLNHHLHRAWYRTARRGRERAVFLSTGFVVRGGRGLHTKTLPDKGGD